jgi:SAM-dependent methyltransferase
MDEAKKTNQIRGPGFVEAYLRGKVIDIGAGPDLVCSWAERFDIEEGDANFITKYRPINSYDAVHSSHSLEHMMDPEAALLEWWSLLKPGGYFIVVVPDEDLYEQGIWPSIFNKDHKYTFRLNKDTSWSPVSFDVRQLIQRLPNCGILSAEVQDHDYDYSLHHKVGDRYRRLRGVGPIYRGVGHIYNVCEKIPKLGILLRRTAQRVMFICGATIDQTMGGALAQIQVVARKHP